MNKSTVQIKDNADFTELQSLLRAEVDTVPYRDLEDRFLDDLHVRIISGKAGGLKPRWFDRFSLPQCSAWSWGGAVTATILLGVMLGLGVYSTNADRAVSEKEPTANNLVFIKADDRVDLSGSIPAFVTKPQEF